MAGPHMYPPGWYPDPWRAGAFRWWDGFRWTDHLSAGPAAVSAGVSPFELQRAHDRERRMWRWARAALLAVLAGVAGQLIVASATAHAWHQLWEQMQNPYSDGQVPTFTGFSGGVTLCLELSSLLYVGAATVFLMWQHSAATVARALGYPARTSPGFGVGSWFIPVASLWFPYWALSDTLPPDHPLRGRCIFAWLAYMGVGVANVVGFFVALASASAAVIPMAIAGVLAVIAVGLGAQLIRAVAEDHALRLGAAAP